MRHLALLCVLLLSSSALAAGAQTLPADAEEILRAQPPERVAKLLDEKVVLLPPEDAAQEPPGAVVALVLFERPLPAVLDQLIDGARQREYRPEIDRLQLIERSDHDSVYEYHLRMLLVQVAYRVHQHWDRERAEVWWELDPRFDNDLAVLEGRWQLHRYGGQRTLARFGHRLELGPALPGFLAEVGTRVKLPEAMQNVRRWIDSGGRYRP